MSQKINFAASKILEVNTVKPRFWNTFAAKILLKKDCLLRTKVSKYFIDHPDFGIYFLVFQNRDFTVLCIVLRESEFFFTTEYINSFKF